jgi:hypothetical protein
MKYFVRAFVVALVLTGAVASTSAATKQPSVKKIGMNTATPTPTCPPNDPNGCGMGDGD